MRHLPGFLLACAACRLGNPDAAAPQRAGNPPALLSLVAQIVPTLLIYAAADWMLERFDDGDTRFR